MERFKEKFDNIYEHILEAKKETQKRYIEANTILINQEIAYSNNLFIQDNDMITEYPPMIFGMKVFYDNNLPNNANFIITNSPKNKLEKINELEESLGIDLITLFNANKVYFKYCEESNEIFESWEVHFDLTNRILRAYRYPEDEFGTSLEISRYGHLWSFDKEDLEENVD